MLYLKAVWHEYLRLDKEYSEKYSSKSPDEYCTKYMKIWSTLVLSIKKMYGEKTYISEYREDVFIISNGIRLYLDGTVYEPLEIVMRRIIEEENEK